MEYVVETSKHGVTHHTIEQKFETFDGAESRVVAELTAENPEYCGNLFSNAEYMLQICKDLNNLKVNGTTESIMQKIEGLQNRARTILTEVGVPL